METGLKCPLEQLSEVEKLEVLAWLQQTLGDSCTLTPEQHAEVQRRLEAAIQNPEAGKSADELFEAIVQRPRNML